MRDNNPTVYSTEAGWRCPKCGRPADKCSCNSGKQKPRPAVDNRPSVPKDGVVRIFRDSKGRKGKTATVITGIPLNEAGLKDLLSELKRKVGSGGAVKDGAIEIQGDHREVLLEELKKRGWTVKLAGG